MSARVLKTSNVSFLVHFKIRLTLCRIIAFISEQSVFTTNEMSHSSKSRVVISMTGKKAIHEINVSDKFLTGYMMSVIEKAIERD